MGCRQLKLDSERALLLPSVLREFEKRRYQTLADRRKRQFLDDPDQPPQPGPNHLQHLECDFRVLHAVCLKIAPRDERNFRILDRNRGSRKWAAIEYRQFRD